MRRSGDRSTSTIERLGPDDLVALASDVGPVPYQVGAVLMLDSPVEVSKVGERLAERIGGVARLRQKLTDAPFGGGCPYWLDDPSFRVENHIEQLRLDNATIETLYDASVAAITRPLEKGRPLWRLTVIDGLEGGGGALVVAFHHLVADGIGGLAVLAHLVDGAGSAPQPAVGSGRAPSDAALRVDAFKLILRRLARLPAAISHLGRQIGALRSARPGRAERCSLNRPTGARRALRVAHVPLHPFATSTRAVGATVNDGLLVAVSAALGRLLAARGESVGELVVSMPVSRRRETSVSDLGNDVAPVPVAIPITGALGERLDTVAERTRVAKANPKEPPTAMVGTVFRALAKVGLLARFLNRQHMVHTFLTNMKGPETALCFLGTEISEVVPIAMVAGNVAVSFAAMSYAGTISVAVLADPEVCPELDDLRRLVDEELAAVTQTTT